MQYISTLWKKWLIIWLNSSHIRCSMCEGHASDVWRTLPALLLLASLCNWYQSTYSILGMCHAGPAALKLSQISHMPLWRKWDLWNSRQGNCSDFQRVTLLLVFFSVEFKSITFDMGNNSPPKKKNTSPFSYIKEM